MKNEKDGYVYIPDDVDEEEIAAQRAIANYEDEQNYLKVHSLFSIERAEAAKAGIGLDELVNDECYAVRAEVAKQGYGLDKLINDPHPLVRAAARKKLNIHYY